MRDFTQVNQNANLKHHLEHLALDKRPWIMQRETLFLIFSKPVMIGSKNLQTQWLTSGERGCALENGSKLTVEQPTLLEKCPNTEFSVSYSVQMQENTNQKKLRIWTFFKNPRKMTSVTNFSGALLVTF